MGNGSESASEAPRASRGAPSQEELRKRFFFHKPRDEHAIKSHEAVSQLTFELACDLCRLCPPGRNLSLALTALEDVRMRANAAIAVDDPRG